MDWVAGILICLGAYLLGSIPSAYILVHLVRGVDIRCVGTGNVGALNTFQQVGVWGALLVLLADAGKGALTVLASDWSAPGGWVLFLATLLVVAGHNWPVFLNFRGGKGAAVIFGISLAVVPWLTLIALGPASLTALLTRNVVIGSAIGFILLNTLLLVTGQAADQIALCILLTVVVTVTYVFSIRDHIRVSIRTRQWRQLFTGLE